MFGVWCWPYLRFLIFMLCPNYQLGDQVAVVLYSVYITYCTTVLYTYSVLYFFIVMDLY